MRRLKSDYSDLRLSRVSDPVYEEVVDCPEPVIIDTYVYSDVELHEEPSTSTNPQNNKTYESVSKGNNDHHVYNQIQYASSL